MKNNFDEKLPIQDKPKICLIDIDNEVYNILKSKGFNCTSGTLGSQVEVPNKKIGDSHLCLLNHDLPSNLHEYDIIAIDLKEGKKIQYSKYDHEYSQVKRDKSYYFLTQYPQTMFDPRGYSSTLLNDLKNKKSIMIVFMSKLEMINYSSVSLTPNGYVREDIMKYYNCCFIPYLNLFNNKFGVETKILSQESTLLGNFLNKYSKSYNYEIIFNFPNPNNYKDILFIPLIANSNDDIISFMLRSGESYFFIFPQLFEKTEFLTELFEEVLPDIFPNIFPYSTQFSWLKNPEYRLPNEEKLLVQKENIELEYKNKLEQVETEIKENYEEYKFLHGLISESGEKLVKITEDYFKWLGFENVINMDETDKGLKEEDIQIILDNGVLVIEVKGIGGTSKDSECSQINKIKYRRSKERNAFDVYALYIVNHERYKPPINRKNPPFLETQIEDAKNDERGLLTTYDLFKLYFNITNGFITKEDARKALLSFGLVKFYPSNSVLIGKPTELFRDGHVGIFFIENQTIKMGDKVVCCEDDFYNKLEILDIQLNGKAVSEISSGEVGIKFSGKIKKSADIWLLKIEMQTADIENEVISK